MQIEDMQFEHSARALRARMHFTCPISAVQSLEGRKEGREEGERDSEKNQLTSLHLIGGSCNHRKDGGWQKAERDEKQ